ncbi:hypothetical protein [Nocardia noduli]|uniref:hypothetical protein n=1 Tax=Nocardia noduli TaxID=2815722 RepID=UPI001C222026|nr:hypothetical protein [Nocardia noduli]
MRIKPPNDRNNGDGDDDDRLPTDPSVIGEMLGDEVEDYLAHVLADVPPLDEEEPPFTPPSRSRRPIGPKRPALHLVPTSKDDHEDRDDAAALDPEAAIEAGRTARTRMVRSAAGGSALVALAAAFACWGESVAVTGPMAVYGTGWVGYLWWNAALRPSFPDTVTAISDGISRAVSSALSSRATPDPDAPTAGTKTVVSVEEVNKPTTDNT